MPSLAGKPAPGGDEGVADAYRPRIVSWNLTAACNLRCPHCYLDAGRRRPDELSTDEGLRLLEELANAGTELLILTGGEPLLRSDLTVLTGHAARMGITVVLGSNGTLIGRAVARTLRANGVVGVGISVDSIDSHQHDAFRGVVGAWEGAIAGAEACRAESLDVVVHTTALRMNLRELPELARLAHDLGARAFHLFFLVCTGRGERLTDLSPHEYEAALNWLIEAQEVYPGMVLRARCAPYVRRLAWERGSSLSWSAGCLAGTSYCRIAPNGDVTPCPYLPRVAASCRAVSFREIWERSDVLAQFRWPNLHLGGKCGDCALSRGENPLCVGCRARALALARDELAADPWCLYEPTDASGARHARVDWAYLDGSALSPSPMTWSSEAQERLARVPSFLRARIRQAAEAHAAHEGLTQVTPEVLSSLRQRAGGHGPAPERPAGTS